MEETSHTPPPVLPRRVESRAPPPVLPRRVESRAPPPVLPRRVESRAPPPVLPRRVGAAGPPPPHRDLRDSLPSSPLLPLHRENNADGAALPRPSSLPPLQRDRRSTAPPDRCDGVELPVMELSLWGRPRASTTAGIDVAPPGGSPLLPPPSLMAIWPAQASGCLCWPRRRKPSRRYHRSWPTLSAAAAGGASSLRMPGRRLYGGGRWCLRARRRSRKARPTSQPTASSGRSCSSGSSTTTAAAKRAVEAPGR